MEIGADQTIATLVAEREKLIQMVANAGCVCLPMSSEYGTYQTVKASFWPWLSGKRPLNL